MATAFVTNKPALTILYIENPIFFFSLFSVYFNILLLLLLLLLECVCVCWHFSSCSSCLIATGYSAAATRGLHSQSHRDTGLLLAAGD